MSIWREPCGWVADDPREKVCARSLFGFKLTQRCSRATLCVIRDPLGAGPSEAILLAGANFLEAVRVGPYTGFVESLDEFRKLHEMPNEPT